MWTLPAQGPASENHCQVGRQVQRSETWFCKRTSQTSELDCRLLWEKQSFLSASPTPSSLHRAERVPGSKEKPPQDEYISQVVVN